MLLWPRLDIIMGWLYSDVGAPPRGFLVGGRMRLRGGATRRRGPVGPITPSQAGSLHGDVAGRIRDTADGFATGGRWGI